ncbi:TadE/TadG family type IV pilus assembly protein [Myxococcota bacterium]
MVKKSRKEAGASATEFALILPLLVVFVFGIIEFSVLLYDKAVITNASREGARTGIVYEFDPSGMSTYNHPDDAAVVDAVNNYVQNHLITFGAIAPPTITVNRAGDATGDALEVMVDYHYDFLLLPTFLTSMAGGADIRGRSVMRME